MEKIIITLLLALLMSSPSYGQDMDHEELYSTILSVSHSIDGDSGRDLDYVNWRFEIDSVRFICSSNVPYDRMKIVAQITETSKLAPEEMKRCLRANFHSSLDTRYAISDGYVWSVFANPLRELSRDRVLDAISQVYSGVKTFGTHYDSALLKVTELDKDD